MTDLFQQREMTLAYHFGDRLAADCVEDGVGTEFLADAPAEPDDPEAPGHYWKNRLEALLRFEDWVSSHHSLTESDMQDRRDMRRAEYELAFEYMQGRGLLIFHSTRPELYRVAELPAAPEVRVAGSPVSVSKMPSRRRSIVARPNAPCE